MPVVASPVTTTGDRLPRRRAEPVSIDIDHWDDVISFSSRIPLHVQLRKIVLDHLRRCGYPAGTRFPTQARLVQRFALGRNTVRRVVNSLIDDGYLARVPGSDRLNLRERPPVAESSSRHRPAASA